MSKSMSKLISSFRTEHGSIEYEVLNNTGRCAGEVSSILLLHNFMSTGHAAWGPMLDGLALNHRVILPDLPGHGRSIGHPEHFDHGVMAHQLAALLHAEDATDAHLAGCSSGGMIAQLIVEEQLVTPASLTLVSTTYSNRLDVLGDPSVVPADFSAGRLWLEATARLHDPHQSNHSHLGDSQHNRSQPSGYYENILLPGFRQLRPETTIDLPLTRLADWTLPVCIIHGECDEFFSVGIAKEMASTLPNATLYVVPDQSHALIFRQPWKVLRFMRAFLQKLPTDPSFT